MRMRSQGIRYYFVPGAAIRHITPASKLSEEYFERLTRMIGVSERIRTLGEGKSAFRRRCSPKRSNGEARSCWLPGTCCGDRRSKDAT